MAKKQTGSVPNKAIYSRLSYLYQAAAYLQTQGPPSETAQGQGQDKADVQDHQRDIRGAASRRLLSDLRAASLKTQIRIDPAVKRTVCKYCDSLLVEGVSCRSAVENKSRGGRKPWADVLVVRCGTCGGEKRVPVAAGRQRRRGARDVKMEGVVEVRGGKGVEVEGMEGAEGVEGTPGG